MMSEKDNLCHLGEFERNEIDVRDKKKDGLNHFKNLYTEENKQQIEHMRNEKNSMALKKH